MTTEERDLISGLFGRLRTADTSTKDVEAEQFIRQQSDALPTAPYLLVQTLLVQEHALQNAQARISALEHQVAAASASTPAPRPPGSFLSGLFHHDSAPASAPGAVRATPFASTLNMPASAGGGFLKGALATAAGVAGGSLLFEGIENLLGHRPGAFGGGLGGVSSGFGGFGGQAPENVEVVNNYYDGASGGRDPQDTGIPMNDDLPADQPVADPSYDDSSSLTDLSGSDAGTDYDAGGGGGDSLA